MATKELAVMELTTTTRPKEKKRKKVVSKSFGKKVQTDPILNDLKSLSLLSDEKLSDILNISVKTYRNYRDVKSEMSDNTRIRAKKVLELYHHGMELFDSSQDFSKWMESKNLYFDNKSPIDFMKRDDGIEFIEAQLTGLEYGDNA